MERFQWGNFCAKPSTCILPLNPLPPRHCQEEVTVKKRPGPERVGNLPTITQPTCLAPKPLLAIPAPCGFPGMSEDWPHGSFQQADGL